MATDILTAPSTAAPFAQPAPSASTTTGGLTRRSLSIFSRRGTETPTPTTQALVATSMTFAFAQPPAAAAGTNTTSMSTPPIHSTTPPRSKRWKLKRTVEPRIPEGTILRAVPQNPAPKTITALEREMAISPNDEILRNIGLSPQTAHPIEPQEPVQPIPTSPVRTAKSPLIDISNTVAVRRPTKRERKNSIPGQVIGVWKDGKAQWESQKLQVVAPTTEEIERPKSAGAGSPPSPTKRERPKRPSIRVIIPNNRSTRRPFTYVPFLSNSAIEPADSKSITVTSIITQQSQARDDASPIDPASDLSHRLSAVSPPTVTHQPKPRRASYIPIQITLPEEISPEEIIHPDGSKQKQTLAPPASSSGSSTTSVSDDEDSVSHHSSHTSITSVSSKAESLRPPVQPKDEVKPSEPQATIEQIKSLRFAANGTHATFGTEHQPAELEGSPVEEQPHLYNLVALMRTPSTDRPPRRRMSSRRGNDLLRKMKSKEEAMNRSAGPRSPSPTLSQAEDDLEKHLSMLSMTPVSPTFNLRISSASLPPDDDAPPPPPKSARRYMHSATGPAMRRSRSFRVEKAPILVKKSSLRRRSRKPALADIEEDTKHKITPNAAENVVFKTLERLDNLEDLFNAALINRGFYSVFKRNELPLMRKVLRNMCPPAWEHRETCVPNNEQKEPDSAHPVPDYTPSEYYQNYMCDTYFIGALKTLILQQCQSFLREETVASLVGHEPFRTSRADNALWRIWTFCRVFGCNKGREDDITAQMDWLRGGVLAHQDDCTGTISTHDSFYLSSVLLSAPEHFAQGNKNGLSAEELYDMTEMWNCLHHITQSIMGRPELARQYGVYDNTEVQGGDIDGEEAMLEEWHSYILSLGLSPILDLANSCLKDDEAAAFALAREQGWTDWNPPVFGGSRSTFLKEAVTRLYEERVCEVFSSADTKASEMRQLRRQRGASFAAEIRQRRLNGASICSERPMSNWEMVMNKLAAPATASSPALLSPTNTQMRMPIRKPPPVPPLRPAPPAPILSRSGSSAQSHHSLVFSASSPVPSAATTPPATQHPAFLHRRYPSDTPDPSWSNHEENVHPAFRHGGHSSPSSHSLTFETSSGAPSPPPYDRQSNRLQHPLQYEMAGEISGLNSVDKAVFRIVEMGFSPDQAKGALKITDMGDGLRVDRAVEYLLRTMEGGD